MSDVLVEWLEDIGHEVSFTSSGERGVELIVQKTPDIVLCDLGLGGMSGPAVCRAVRANPQVRQPFMVALTGWGREEDRQRTNDAGFDHHLVKPAAPEKLLALLRTISG